MAYCYLAVALVAQFYVMSNKEMIKTHIIFSVMLTVFLISCSEDFYSYYQSYDEAQEKGAVDAGWLPEIIPSSATEIHEQHNIDSNEIWIRFKIPENDQDRIKSLKKLNDEEIKRLDLRYTSKADWWFEGLIQKSPANDAALNADIYYMSCKTIDSKAYIAIDCCSSNIYYWCTY